jgi:microcystin-dependent protein
MTPYIGEVRMFAGNFAPAGWLLCQGQELAVSEYDGLYAVIGNTYGGTPDQSFKLPDLQGRVPIATGNGFQAGAAGGVEKVAVTVAQLPPHGHDLVATTSAASTSSPAQGVLAAPATPLYAAVPGPIAGMAGAAVGPAGGSQPHENMQPFLCINFIISLYGSMPA